MTLYSHETKPNLCLLISFPHCDHFYNWLYDLYLFCCTFIANIKLQQHLVVKLKMALQQYDRVPILQQKKKKKKKKTVLNECNRPRKNPFKQTES